MKFAEMTQEVQIARPTPIKPLPTDAGLTPGRRKANQLFRIAVNNLGDLGHADARKLNVDLGLVYSLGPNFPDYRLDSPEADQIIVQLMHHLEQRIQKRKLLIDDFDARRKFLHNIYFEKNVLKYFLFIRIQLPNDPCRNGT